MDRRLTFGIHSDSFQLELDIPLEEIENGMQRLMDRAQERREQDALGGPQPLRFWVMCPCCGADASHLGHREEEGRKVRVCSRCRSLFEVDEGEQWDQD